MESRRIDAPTTTKTETKPTAAPVEMANAQPQGQALATEASPAAGKKRSTADSDGVRLPYYQKAAAAYGLDKPAWKVLVEAIWPAASSVDSVLMALAYCKARNLDPFKRVVHIVPMWSKDAGGIGADGKPIAGMIETVWPGIAELRTTAFRTKQYAGLDTPEYGPMMESKFTHTYNSKTENETVKHPEWVRITVNRLLNGALCKFVGPKTVWLETYASASNFSEIPNRMWRDRPEGQIEKCAEAAALRRAFPEELGNEYAAEEMEGRVVVGSDIGGVARIAAPEIVAPPIPKAATVAQAAPAKTEALDEKPIATRRAEARAIEEEALEIPANMRRPLPDDTTKTTGDILREKPGIEFPEAYLAWVDKLLGSVTEKDGLEVLETAFNAFVEPDRAKLFPPDVAEVDRIYEKHERRISPE